MKRAFITMLLFFWAMHFALPMLYYINYGFFNLYNSTVDDPAILQKAFWMNTSSIFVTIAILATLPDKKIPIEPKYRNLNALYYITCIYMAMYSVLTGGFAGAISGNMAGSIFSYINQFIDVSVIFALMLFYQRKRYNILLFMLSFLILRTASGSRSAVITLFIITIIFFPLFCNYEQYKKKIRYLIIVLSVISPLLFYYATSSRGGDLNGTMLSRMIVGRLSMLELSMIPINCKDNSDSNCNLDIFYEKYNLARQILLAIDSMYPGDIFISDVFPNQYYRSAFFGSSEEYSKENYMSINMSLPSFFYMYTGTFMACVLTIAALIIYYIMWVTLSSNTYFFVAFMLSLYTFLYSFDFTMWLNQLYVSMITILSVNVYVALGKKLIIISRKKQTGQPLIPDIQCVKIPVI